MIKPPKLNIGDIIATISPSWGCAGDEDVMWSIWENSLTGWAGMGICKC